MNARHIASTLTRLIFLLLIAIACFFSNTSAYAQGCAADFTARGTSGCSPLTVHFYDQSTGEVTSRLWIFYNPDAGEEIQSQDTNPQITFTTVGLWDVTLTITCARGGDASTTKESFVTVQDCQQECVADFHADDREGCAPFTTTFYDDSDGALYWNWYFEGGSPSSATGQGPHTVTFNNPGTYDVTLDIECDGGSDVTVKQDYITVNNCPSPCEVAFDADPRDGCAPLTVNFTDLSVNAQSWEWKFPGGSPATSTQQNPTVTYQNPGTYAVSLKITCESGTVDSLTVPNYIVVDYCPSPCEVAFDADPKGGCAPLTVNFTDLSTNAQSWEWKFPGGSPATSTQQHPTVTYQNPGSYAVYLKITCASGGVDSLLVPNYIVVDYCPSPCEVAFDANPRGGCAPLTVNFTDLSVNAQSWEWKFPGGSPATSTQQHPTVTYQNPGSYAVSLKITCESGGVDSLLVPNYIVVDDCPSPCEVAFDADPRGGCAPLMVNFTDLSVNAQSWEWKFPGGSPATSTQQHPTVTYQNPGSYAVSLKITCESGTVDSLTVPNYIVVDYCPSPCETAFEADPRGGCAPLTVNFTDLSVNAQSWEWKFPGGSPATSTQQHPTVSYQHPGSYAVSLKITCENGSVDSLTVPNYIVVDYCPSPCEAAFDATPRQGCAPLTVNFTDQSINAQSWYWSYPGGTPSSSNQQNPTIVYSAPGTYAVELKIICQNGGVDSLLKVNYIHVEDCGHEEMDFGDAPDPTYPTLLASNGARHVIKPYFHLGSAIDAEPNGYPSSLSDGDDVHPAAAPNDEDGVTMSPFVAPGQSVPITVVASDSGILNAWLDFNINGSWADAGEHFIAAVPLYPGANALTLNVPATASLGLTYARFRFSSSRQLSFDGPASDGEVEDYAVEIVHGDDGSVTVIKEAIPKDDTPFQICQYFSSGFFNVLCGTLKDPSNNKLTILNPGQLDKVVESVTPGWVLTAIDITGDMDNGSVVDLVNGSVDVDYDTGEHIVITFKNRRPGGDELFDFGDAPDPGYPTLLANNGARHVVTPNLFLGSQIDAEPNGQPSSMATGDDQGLLYPGVPFPAGDEDGVLMPSIVSPGQSVPITVIASASGTLNAWFDFNGNGSWADAGEHIIPAMPVVAGANNLAINVPASAKAGQSYARFRLSSDRSISFDGLAPDGEVEDYAVGIQGGEGGNITIIKDATPKDNTPFWISVVYGVMGGAAPYRDPLSNTSTMTGGPVGTYHVGESVPPGWNLMDIVVTGDSDHGSAVDVANAKVDIDLDAGESITVVFKNNKSGEEELYDLGDAPDGTNHSGLPIDAYPGVPGNYPTVFDPATGVPQGPLHRLPRADAWLGPNVSGETDADIMPDTDGLTNIDPPNNAADRDGHDDGVRFPISLPQCQQSWFNYIITIPPGSVGNDRYVNVWFDWNRDGDWADAFQCEKNNDTPEWAVQNQLIPGGLGAGTHVFATPLFRVYHADGAIDKPIWMRISIADQVAPTPGDGRGPANGYLRGETEDYYFFAEDTTGERIYDFGDAPDDDAAPGYPTLHVNGGAYHDVVEGFHLGSLIDSEPNGQPTANAMGDDNNDMDDEDGVTFSTPLIPGQVASVQVVASTEGILNAWIDYNANKSWIDPNEHVLIDVALTSGNNTLTFNVPATAAIGATFARFRFSRVQGIVSTGYGRAGEVEDYLTEIMRGGEGRPYKWMQIPLLNENPDMPYTPCYWGWDVRSVYGGTFVADDWFCKSPAPVTDIHWWGSYAEWDSAFAPPIAPHAFHIGIWRDMPKGKDNDWSHPGELVWARTVPRAMLNEHVVGDDFHPDYMTKPDTCFQYDYFIPEDEWFYQESDSTIYWLSISAVYEEEPDSYVWGWKTREHFFHDDAVYVYEPEQPTVGDITIQTGPIAERWDMAYVLGTTEYALEFDFGDAPMERYPTLFEHNGALHIYNPKVYLGEHIDTEKDGQPDHTCTGDDNDGLDDDDGVFIIAPTGGEKTTSVEIRASCPGFLNAWMDFNNNGSWADPDEQIFVDEPLPGGPSILPIPVPDDAVPSPIFSRFRFSTEPGLSYVGIAIDGEVEDYYLDLVVDKVEASDHGKLIPKSYQLYQNYPNPFNATTELRYDLPKDGPVTLSLYNLTGAEVRVLLNERQPAGQHRISWDGRDNAGHLVPSGLYLVKMQAGEFTATRKIVMLK
jgi:PKD repeat protein